MLPRAGTCTTYTHLLGFISRDPSRFLGNAWPWIRHVSIHPGKEKWAKKNPFSTISFLRCSGHNFRLFTLSRSVLLGCRDGSDIVSCVHGGTQAAEPSTIEPELQEPVPRVFQDQQYQLLEYDWSWRQQTSLYKGPSRDRESWLRRCCR